MVRQSRTSLRPRDSDVVREESAAVSEMSWVPSALDAGWLPAETPCTPSSVQVTIAPTIQPPRLDRLPWALVRRSCGPHLADIRRYHRLFKVHLSQL